MRWLEHTRKVAFVHDREFVRLDEMTAVFFDAEGQVIQKAPRNIPYDEWKAQKGDFRHFLEKEIHEQPEALVATIRPMIQLDPPRVIFEDVQIPQATLKKLRRVVLVGMGTSEYAAQLGKTYMERIARLAASAEDASEFRYADPVIDEETLVVALSQSGETADTLVALQEARDRGATVLTVCNVPGAASTRMAHGVIYTRCGPERSVASTKTYVSTVSSLYLLACWLGHERGVIDDARLAELLHDISRLPDLVGRALETAETTKDLAKYMSRFHSVLFLGRGAQLATAYEGALKLKELSYIHAEGYPAGKLKHGPLTLIDEQMPTVAIATHDALFEKMVNSIQEVRARGGFVVAIGSEGDDRLTEVADRVVSVPADVPELLQPLVAVVPLQLLAYEIAVWLGKDVDQPRNLAKTVTVE